MAYKTNISWSQSTWSPVVGCTKVSEGCQNCYAEKMACRLNQMAAANGDTETWEAYSNVLKFDYSQSEVGKPVRWNNTVYCRPEVLEQPLHWKKPRQIFVCSMGDLFHKDVPDLFVCKVHDIIKKCPQHTFQVLTKRPDRMYDHLIQHPYPNNLYIGVSIELSTYNYRANTLRQIPAAKRFVSFEPLLDDIGEVNLTGIDQIIIGAESIGGHAGRECKLEWVRSLVAQAKAAGCKVHVKQIHLWQVKGDDRLFETELSAWMNTDKKAKRVLVKKIEQFPEDLRLQETI